MKHDLSFDELCKLIEICNNNDVSSIKLGEMELTFKETRLPKEDVRIEVPLMAKEIKLAPEPIEEVDPAILRQLEADIKQAELDQMMINDPAQFEELLNVGDFVNESE